MSKKVLPPVVVPEPVDFSISDLAEAHLTVQRTPELSVGELVCLLLGQAVADAEQGEDEDAGGYALLAAQLIRVFGLELTQ